MSKIKKLAGETVLYGLGSMVPRMLNFLLLPLHTRDVFNAEQYSVITKMYAIVAFLNILYMFGMETTFFRFATKPDADPKKIFNQAQTAVVIISVSLSIFFIALASPIATLLNADVSSADAYVKPQYVVWLTLVMLIDALVAIPFARLRLERKPLLFSTGKIINVCLLLGLNVYFLLYNLNGYDPLVGPGYVFMANLLANSFYILFLFPSLLSWRPVIEWKIFYDMARYAYPIMLTGIAGMTNEMFSRLTLEWWLPKDFYLGRSEEHALGVFGACYKFAVLMNLAVQAFRFAAEPFFFSNAADKNSPELFAKINHYFVLVCCILLFGVSVNLDILKYFTGEEYWEGLHIVPILLVAYLFLGVYYNFTVWFKLTDKTYFGTIITISGAIVTIGLNYLLIPLAGYTGSAWAALICYFTMTAACYMLGKKYYPIPYAVLKGMVYIIVTVLLIYGVGEIVIEDQFMSITFHMALLVLYVIGILLIERKGLRRALA